MRATLKYLWPLFQWLLVRIYAKMKRRGTRPTAYFDKDGVPIDHQAFLSSVRFGERTFLPNSLDSRGVLIRANSPGEELLPGYDFTNGWHGLFSRGLEIVQATGDHGSMVGDENVASLARQINEVLDR